MHLIVTFLRGQETKLEKELKLRKHQLKASGILGQILEQKKAVTGKTSEILIKSVVHSIESGLVVVLELYKMLTTVSVSLPLLQNNFVLNFWMCICRLNNGAIPQVFFALSLYDSVLF